MPCEAEWMRALVIAGGLGTWAGIALGVVLSGWMAERRRRAPRVDPAVVADLRSRSRAGARARAGAGR